ncbi:HNH endonuclease [Paenibacillus cremeus]|uniref:HNH endonuclease n=1 Tax=Paenibacillus cremeus TaxID=2163881 RepID=A0A559KFI7_9BACL|nr:HNH endonuclease [Paenibacillus cremeus]TVY10886.1 HNH endonuclease [Paenibacillus cremeus]
MDREITTTPVELTTAQPSAPTAPIVGIEESLPQQLKVCAYCLEPRPLTEFIRRTGRKAGKASRRGACRTCRKLRKEASIMNGADGASSEDESVTAEPAALLPIAGARCVRRIPRPIPAPPPPPKGLDLSELKATRQGIVRMRGRTDKGRRWLQETDLETAATLVREFAAVVVNRHTIRRIYSNKMFKQYILSRDEYTCYFCGEYGDTIDHLLPRAKGGHTTPLNCVCACSLCNQSKADRSLEEFMISKKD